MLQKSIAAQLDALVVTAKSLKSLTDKNDKSSNDWLAIGALVGQLGKQITESHRIIRTASELEGVKDVPEFVHPNTVAK